MKWGRPLYRKQAAVPRYGTPQPPPAIPFPEKNGALRSEIVSTEDHPLQTIHPLARLEIMFQDIQVASTGRRDRASEEISVPSPESIALPFT